jgi:hypothetical protein
MRRDIFLPSLAALLVCAHTTAVGQSARNAQLQVAEYTADGQLVFPSGTERWITVGTGLGGDYGEQAFDPQNPGTITVVQMEPAAYDYFVQNERYADGTMLLLTFYSVQQKPEPQLRGFVQQDAVQREIHVIDRSKFAEESRAFFLFPLGSERAPAMPVGSECVVCHEEHGDFDATFTQFYPVVRHLAPAEAP